MFAWREEIPRSSQLRPVTPRISVELVIFCPCYVDDILLVDKILEDVDRKLELWRDISETKGFKLSKFKIGHMHCKFSERRASGRGVTLAW